MKTLTLLSLCASLTLASAPDLSTSPLSSHSGDSRPPTAAPAASSDKDVSCEARARSNPEDFAAELCAAMSLDEKIAQMVMSYIDYLVRKDPEDFAQVGFINKGFHNRQARWL